MSKITIYFFPGMAASSLIFEHLNLDDTLFNPIFLEWLPTNKQETLDQYVNRYIPLIKHESPVLLGVSFGGIIAQEISKKINVKKTIIISSVRSIHEYPSFFKWAKKIKAYKLIPTIIIPIFTRIFFVLIQKKKKNRIDLYEKYLSVRDPKYIKWCIEAILNWTQTDNLPNVIQIHGSKDQIFPIKKIKNCVVIKDGTHAMIIIKHKWFNNNLQSIILD